MKKEGVEKNLVVLLFVMVLVVFSFAERDSKKLDKLYNTVQLVKKGSDNVAAHIMQVEERSAAN